MKWLLFYTVGLFLVSCSITPIEENLLYTKLEKRFGLETTITEDVTVVFQGLLDLRKERFMN
jgi:hypothetical protein